MTFTMKSIAKLKKIAILRTLDPIIEAFLYNRKKCSQKVISLCTECFTLTEMRTAWNAL